MLAVSEANFGGYDEAILLTPEGLVADGSGENIFVVRDGVLYTPDLATGILPGLTRDAVIQIAHDLGYKTINVVRREELIEELRTEGGDVVLVDGEILRDEVKSVTGGAPIRLGLNAVGGDSALRLANTLAPESTMVTFGAMSLQPLKIPNGLLIFKDLRFRGIWINKWYNNATMQERMDTFRPLFEMAKRGLLKTKVEKSYPMGEMKTAVAHAAQGKRGGKIIFEFGA